MTVLTAPDSTATIDIQDDDTVKRFEQAGWTQVETPKRPTKKADEKPAEK